MKVPQIVLDTNVLLSALRSRRGASHRLLQALDCGKFETNVSVPLVLEYESVAKRLVGNTPLTEQNVGDIIDYLCTIANHRDIYYLWRPFLRDPRDDMVLELAVAAGCEAIVSFNKRDFAGSESFGVSVLTPREFLREIGEIE